MEGQGRLNERDMCVVDRPRSPEGLVQEGEIIDLNMLGNRQCLHEEIESGNLHGNQRGTGRGEDQGIAIGLR